MLFLLQDALVVYKWFCHLMVYGLWTHHLPPAMINRARVCSLPPFAVFSSSNNTTHNTVTFKKCFWRIPCCETHTQNRTINAAFCIFLCQVEPACLGSILPALRLFAVDSEGQPPRFFGQLPGGDWIGMIRLECSILLDELHIKKPPCEMQQISGYCEWQTESTPGEVAKVKKGYPKNPLFFA